MKQQPFSTISWTTLFGKIVFLLVLMVFAFQLLSVPRPWILLDNVNFLIHEGGHLLFFFFGQFIYLLGGSLTQILVPTLFFIYFLKQRQFFSAGFGLFWMGDNLISVSVYMKDARTQTLPLFGEIHDWNWLFSALHLLPYDQVIGNFFYILGALCLLLSLLGMAASIFIEILILRQMKQNLTT